MSDAKISLDNEEEAVIDALADVWNMFLALKEIHATHRHEFMHAIHAAQNIVISRAYVRNNQKDDER